MGGSTTTKQVPSLLDAIRADFAGKMGPDVLGNIFSGLREFPTADQMVDLYSKWRTISGGMGSSGVGPGDPRMLEQFGKATKDAFGVNHDALNAAIQLFTGTPGGTGGEQSSTSPGVMGIANNVASLAQGGAMLGNSLNAGSGGGGLTGLTTGLGTLGSTVGTGVMTGARAAANLVTKVPFVFSSSRDLKQDIEPLESEDCLKRVCSLRSVGYTWKHNAEHDAGLIAEELMEVIPEAGGTVGGYNGIKPLTVIGYLVESIKQLNNELNALKAQNGGDR